jgi:uncharacterized membrane protein (DUF106 family)
MSFLAHLTVWLNALANLLGRIALAPIAVLPGWLSATLVAVVTGVLLLFVFKHTSNQRAIKRARDDIKAHLLAIKLFKESVAVALRAQGRILWGALRLAVLAVVPMLVMAVPVCLLLGQLALWYQARPLRVGEEAVLTVKLSGAADSDWPDVRLQPTDAVEVEIGPVRVESQRELCWNLKARENGYHRLVLEADDKPDEKQLAEKQLAIGEGFMRVSPRRPAWDWTDELLNPWEQPFRADSPIQSIDIQYPDRKSWTSGTNHWVIYWFVASMVGALCFRRALNVQV